MGMLVPTALAAGLLSLFQQQLDSLWSGLAILFCWFRLALKWLGSGRGQPQPQVRTMPEETPEEPNDSQPTVPVSVNYHFTRQCNYKCGFCFHTAKTSFVLPLEEAKRGLLLLKQAGMEKINFSGGEPFLQDRGEYVGKLVRFCKEELALPSVSIVSNGSLIREKWFRDYGNLDNVGVVFTQEIHFHIGSDSVTECWSLKHMRFLNCTGGRKDPSKSILDVGVEEAIKFSGFDEKMFLKRGGKYVWSKADLKLDW
ncbi:radical S-adenosyl methionine domain-containing protein 2 [Microtus ochrogaster]|uniref:Radical S-adenosyl methionine domain-containing protein 2 n=1 Tax=Microtus ochrogaster TaxID=79684 RepID=A0ABM0LI36_MICOH|nr:radical S-adenosyl methionine domain-containing protein 2 [Microtus ochrogaster]